MEKDKTINVKQLCSILSAASAALGIIVCAIIDMAINGTFSWSLYPIASIVLVFLLAFPIIHRGKKGIVLALCVLTVVIIPYLYALDRIAGTEGVIVKVGGVIAFLVLIYLWLTCLIIKLCKGRMWLGIGIAMFLAAPLSVLINYSLSLTLTPEAATFDVWDVLDSVILLAGGVALICFDFILKKKSK